MGFSPEIISGGILSFQWILSFGLDWFGVFFKEVLKTSNCTLANTGQSAALFCFMYQLLGAPLTFRKLEVRSFETLSLTVRTSPEEC